ncbi:response regulator [bacterium]|nr:response regulator [bacterium]
MDMTTFLLAGAGAGLLALAILLAGLLLRQRRSARALRARTAAAEALLAALPAPVFWSRDGRALTGGNPAFARALGLDVADSLADRHPEESGLTTASAETFASRNAAVIASGEAALGAEERLLLKDGSERYFLADRVPLGADPGVLGLYAEPSALREALQRERTAREEAEQKLQARAETLAGLSHEIRTPMNAIMGMTELALQTRLDHEQREYLEAVQLSSEHLLGVLSKVFEMALLETGRVDLEPVDFRLDDLLRHLESSFRAQAEAKGLSFGIALESELPPVLHGDLQRLQRILSNLISNAVKFTEQGSVSLRVGELAKDREWIRMRFEVADSGVGIPPDKLEAVFSPFARSSTSCAKEGSGLGLSLSRDLAGRLGGRIQVTSQPGRGSRFSLELPLEYRTGASAPARLSEEPRPTSRGLRILLVEDNAVNQRLAVRLLEKAGFSATEAWNGEEALTLLRRHGEAPFDLLLMDLQMPILDGFAATRLIREEERADGGHLPIIAMTAHAMAGARERCLAAGMDGYVAKPVRQETLLAEIDAVLRRLAESGAADSGLDAEAALTDKEPAGPRER